MQLSRMVKTFILVVVVVALAGCSATPTRRSFKEGWKDSIVSTKVKYKFTKDKLVKKRNIDVDVWRGVVTLTGRVTSMEEKERAEQLSWQANGVRGVDNFLKLVEDWVPATEAVADRTVVETDMRKGVEGSRKKVITIGEENAKPSHPLKVVEAKVNNKVEQSVVAKEKPIKKKWTATRTYNKPNSSQIVEEDLTSEQSLAQEAAEELRRLRGEDDLTE